MNYKSIILAVLLVPMFSYADSKEDQIKYLKDQVDIVEHNLTCLDEELAYEALLFIMTETKNPSTSKSIRKEIRDLEKYLVYLHKKLKKLGIVYESE
jgi:hypothetical protein